MDGEELLGRASEWGERLKTWGLKTAKDWHADRVWPASKRYLGAAGRDMHQYVHEINNGKVAKAIEKHPYKYIIPAAMAAGVYMAHPIKSTHPFAFAQDLAFDDPHAFRTIAYSEANDVLNNAFYSKSYNNYRHGLFQHYTMGNSGNSYYGNYNDPAYGLIASTAAGDTFGMTRGAINVGLYNDDAMYGEAMIRQEQQNNPRYGLSGPDMDGPDGSIVFGMYNRRLNG